MVVCVGVCACVCMCVTNMDGWVDDSRRKDSYMLYLKYPYLANILT